jgi:hypothetical protein
MRRIQTVLISALIFVFLGIGTSFADPLPPGTSDRFFATDLSGNNLFELDFVKGGPESGTTTCGGCTDAVIALVEQNGSVSDIFTLVNTPPGSGNGIVTWTSDINGQVLVAPAAATLLQETSEPIEITDIVGISGFGQRAFIQSDIDAVPEPSAVMLLATALLGMALVGRKRCAGLFLT